MEDLSTVAADVEELLKDFFRHIRRLSVVGLRHRGIRLDSRHHCRGHRVPAPASSASRARVASGREPFLSTVAVADDRHGDKGMGCRSPQAPCDVRNPAGPA